MRRMFAFIKATIFILAACSSVLAQSVADTHKKIIDAADNKAYPAAIALLQDLNRSDERIFQLNNYDYLLARLL